MFYNLELKLSVCHCLFYYYIFNTLLFFASHLNGLAKQQKTCKLADSSSGQ